jgi:asparaginyl-tRNA synthetase
MINNILISQIGNFLGKTVAIQGWLYNKRSSGSIQFLQIRDGSGIVQGVLIKNSVKPDLFNQISQLTLESAIKIIGRPKKEKRSPSGYEIEIKDIKIQSQAEEDYPIGKKEHGVAFLLNNRHLWLRSPRQRAIQLIRNHLIWAINDFYRKNNFIKIDTPIFTPNACEGTTTLFEVDYFGKKAYLSQSGQLYLEAAIFSFGRVYDFSPVFRAEKSKTRRHLIEFWMTNAEAAFVDHEENLSIQEKLIEYVVKSVLDNCQEELNLLKRNIKPLKKVKKPFYRLTYKEALKKLHKLGSDIKDGEDLGNDDETLLTSQFDKPVFVQFYPANVKAFYMKRHPTDPSLAECADLLAPEGYGEIIGGSQREDNYKILLDSIKKHHYSRRDFQWYLDLRKYGSVVHSGFGLGLERLITWICGLKHVRETIPFPRLLNRFYP